MNDAPHLANGRFARGFNCAQSIFAAFAPRLGVSSELALRVSAPFGAGLAREGEVCGALSGALMVLGLQYGQDRPESKEDMYRLAHEFIYQFEQRHGAVRCSELLHQDISTPQGLQAAKDKNLFTTVCPLLVDETAKALAIFLDNHRLPS